jgi:hypothetical protein
MLKTVALVALLLLADSVAGVRGAAPEQATDNTEEYVSARNVFSVTAWAPFKLT